MKHFLVGSVIEANEEEHMALKFTWKLWRRLYGLLRSSPDHLTILQENGLIFSQQLLFRSVSTSEMRTDRPLSLKKFEAFFLHICTYTLVLKKVAIWKYTLNIYIYCFLAKNCVYSWWEKNTYIFNIHFQIFNVFENGIYIQIFIKDIY